MTKITIVGTGNVSKHLFQAFSKQKSLEVIQVIGRSTLALSPFESSTDVSTKLADLKVADLCIIAVKDDAIAEVAGKVPLANQLLVHCSGAVDINLLPSENRKGVFYPLQSFTAERSITFDNIPICIEAQNNKDQRTLEKLAGMISSKVYKVTSEQRRTLHLAAVFVNNFTNHLYHIGQRLCREQRLPFEILHPLIRETAEKIETVSPFEAQTGPARRGDISTLNSHRSLLKNQNYSEIYSLLSKSIQNVYGDEL